MPFREVSRMEDRLDFVTLAWARGANMRGLCRRFAISPTTGCNWLSRWRRMGDAGLAELSRRVRRADARPGRGDHLSAHPFRP